MKMVNVEVLPVRDGEVVSATIVIERKRNADWVREETRIATSGSKGASRKVMLEDDQRLVVEGVSSQKMVYDRNQNALVAVEPIEPRRFAEVERLRALGDARRVKADEKRRAAQLELDLETPKRRPESPPLKPREWCP